jgi:hypothetical protein
MRASNTPLPQYDRSTPERGSALLTSVALMVVLSSMGAALSNMYVSNSGSTAENVALSENINLAQTGLNLGGFILKETECLTKNRPPGYYVDCICQLADNDGHDGDGDKNNSNNGLGNNVDEDGERTMCDPSNPSDKHSECDEDEDIEAHGKGSGNEDEDKDKGDGDKDKDGSDETYTLACDLFKVTDSNNDASSTPFKEDKSLGEIKSYLTSELASTQDAQLKEQIAAVLTLNYFDSDFKASEVCSGCSDGEEEDDGDKDKSNNGLGNNVDEDGERTMCDPSNPSDKHSECDEDEDIEAHGKGSNDDASEDEDEDEGSDKDKDEGSVNSASCNLKQASALTLTIEGDKVQVNFSPESDRYHVKSIANPSATFDKPSRGVEQQAYCSVDALTNQVTIRKKLGTWKELRYIKGVEQ